MLLGSGMLLCTGVCLNLLSQIITDTKFADPSAHIVPWVKFSATMLFSLAVKLRQGPTATPPTPRQHHLMALVGTLDAVAYVTFCLGFTLCGAALSSVVLSGAAQVCTALASRFVLHKRLSLGQVAAVGYVCCGLAIRAIPASRLPSILVGTAAAAAPPTPAFAPEQLRGVAFVLVAAVLYSAVGVTYEALVKSTGKPPQYGDILQHTSKIGEGGGVLSTARASSSHKGVKNWGVGSSAGFQQCHPSASCRKEKSGAHLASPRQLSRALQNLSLCRRCCFHRVSAALHSAALGAARGAAPCGQQRQP